VFCRVKTFGGVPGFASRHRMFFILEEDILYLLVPAKARTWWQSMADCGVISVQIGSATVEGSAVEITNAQMIDRVRERFRRKYLRMQYMVDLGFREAILVRIRVALQEDSTTA